MNNNDKKQAKQRIACLPIYQGMFRRSQHRWKPWSFVCQSLTVTLWKVW